ncbi:MAG: CPBP family intramembrane metalloprotease [Deltaproteobacteria bacterium]|nr:CPBP family intramembrane metalloprotease [Deltaproteobacteria bacterium]
MNAGGSERLALVSIVMWFAATSARPFGIWISLGGTAVALGVAIWVLDRTAMASLLRPSLKLVLLGLTAGGAMTVATYLLYPVLSRMLPVIVADTERLYAAFRVTSPLIAFVALFPVIFSEEMVWRGVVQNAISHRFGAQNRVRVQVIIALVTLIYALVHAPLGSPVLFAAALGCGLVWSTLRAVTGSLIPSLVAHLVWNGLVLVWLPLDAAR